MRLRRVLKGSSVTDEQWRRARPVLTQAVGLNPAERDRLLQSAFGSESGLRGELLKVLREYSSATLRLCGSPRHASSTPQRGGTAEQSEIDESADTPFLTAGEMCGRYRIVRLLGVGGMGQVYLAEDIDLGTPVALKLVSNALLDSPDARVRLRHEAARAAQLRYYPHIATVLQFTEVDLKGRTVAVLAMEYVAGTPANKLLADGPIRAERVIRWAIQVAKAIEFAHEKGILHCDLKPANLQIEETSAGDRVKVLDFGIARAVYDSALFGDAAGTPSYMAPEQLVAGECGPATDIYALGVTIFELVTGRRPYEGVDTADLLVQIIGAPVPKASAVAANVPGGLDRVLQRAMAKEPEQRHSSMAEFRRDLDALLPRDVKSRARLIAGTAAGLLAFVTLLGFATSQALDQGLGRASSFGMASLFDWFYWGARSLIAPVVFSLTLLLAFAVVTSAARLIWSVFGSRAFLQPMATRVRSSFTVLARQPTSVLCQMLLLVHVVNLGALAVYFSPLLTGFMNFMMASRGSIDALRPSNLGMQEMYGYLVTSELLVFCIAWFLLLGLRARRRERDGTVYIVAGLAAVVLSAFLFSARFRILAHAESERVVYGSETCYLIEERASAALLFCPRTYPRNVVGSPGMLVRTGKIESIFTALDE